MHFRQLLNDTTACASYLFGCKSKSKFAVVDPHDRFWRDSGYVAGALLAGLAADGLGFEAAIAIVAGLTAASGLWVAAESPPTRYLRSGRGERRSAPARI